MLADAGTTVDTVSQRWRKRANVGALAHPGRFAAMLSLNLSSRFGHGQPSKQNVFLICLALRWHALDVSASVACKCCREHFAALFEIETD